MAAETSPLALWNARGEVWRTPAGDLPTLSVPDAAALPAVLRATLPPDAWLLHDGGLGFGRRGPLHVRLIGGPEVTWPGGWSRHHPDALPGARPWQRPDWPEVARDRVDARLGALGLTRAQPVEPSFSHDLMGIHRVPLGDGRRAWLKVSADGREAALTAHLAARHPDLLPPVLHADSQNTTLLTLDGGALLDGVPDPAAWTGALERLAAFQLTADAPALADLGAPTLTVPDVAARVDALLADPAPLRAWGLSPDEVGALRDLRPAVAAAFRDLHAHGLPAGPVHGDAHPRNALHGPERGSVWFDWSEAALAHPFMDAGWFLSFTLHPARAALPVRAGTPDLPERLAGAYLRALGAGDAAGLLWRSLPLAHLHRAALFDGAYRDWTGTVPGIRPNFTPFSLRQALREAVRL
ncbi:phosphotransferase [Deinococcus kurensis]|uniref:phosphotransferase n=1 Tax=Deinococcus kurensis TaxID=2662757 RepID=UPI0012D314C5|nr:phosphotransferase [Deinococcus kurensis]